MGKYTLLTLGILATGALLTIALGLNQVIDLLTHDPYFPRCRQWSGHCDPVGVGLCAGMLALIVELIVGIVVLERRATWLALQR